MAKKTKAKKAAPKKKKVAAKKPAKKLVIKKKAAPKPAKKVQKKIVVKAATKKVVALKPVVSKKVEVKKTGAQKGSLVKAVAAPAPKKIVVPKKAYQMHVEEKVLCQVRPHIVPLAGRVPSVAAHFPEHLRVRKVEDGRLYLVDDQGNPHVPSLIEMQLLSYKWFLTEGLKELLEEISPITDFSGKKLELRILGHTFDPPKYDPDTCRRRNLSYEAAMKGHVQLINRETGEIKEQDVFLGSIPLMTDSGTFIVDGIERVVVHQLVRSPRVFGYDTDTKIIDLFSDVSKKEQDYIQVTLDKDSVRTVEEAYQSVYRKIRPGDLATPENAKQLIDSLFFDFKKYDMGTIARYKLNRRFNVHTPSDEQHRVFQVKDFIEILKELVRLNNGEGVADDIDHLSNRRVRSVGELVQNKYRVGLVRTERIIKDRMTVMDMETVTPTQLINCRPITAAMREFFASSQLSQFMDQTNPLAELAHKRRLSAMGPGGLSRERASFDVRDVHTSHYGRICPIATPEGPNIGLVVHLASYSRVNEYGFLETPYREIAKTVKMDPDALLGRMVGEPIREGKSILLKEGEVVSTKAIANKVISALKKEGRKEVPVRAYVSGKMMYVDADQERYITAAQASSFLNEIGEFTEVRVSARHAGEPLIADVTNLTHMDMSPKQILSISTSLIPFLEHDDNTRASMGTNMLRQSVPLIRPESPLVGTGMEGEAARAAGHAIISEESGQVTTADANEITVVYNSGKKVKHSLRTFERSNQATCFHVVPRVRTGEKVKKGQGLGDGAGVENGELALGRNLLVAYMPWGGYNFEDAVILSDRIVRDGLFDSIHIESYVTDMRDTKLGPETITRDIPNVGEAKLKDLDQDGIVRLGATVHEGDILAGKITPKGETELTPEERLLQAIFGDKAKDVKDSSLRLPGGEGGKVVGIQIFDRSEGMELPTGVIRQVKVFVAQTRKIQVGDKMAGRHGNKGVVSKIVPQEDMPFLEDGTPVDVILNPLGVTSRMNIGQILETHLGWAAKELGVKFATPALNGITTEQIEDFLEAADLPRSGKVQLFDGRSGQPFDHKTTVGIVYVLKLLHLVEDKIHARSVGPYSLVTQQPLGGKAQHGGQRFGEMEVWALEAYGAAHVLQEMLTIKSDDVVGRSKAYEPIVKGEPIKKPSTPESFNVLVKELQALGLKVDLLKFSDEVPAEAPAVELEGKEAEVVRLKTRFDEEKEQDDLIPATDTISDLEAVAEDAEEIKKGVEEGDLGDATGVTQKEEM